MSELNFALFITNIGIAVLVGVLLPIIPILTRKSFLFGVKVPIEAQDTEDAKKLRKRYITICLAGVVVLLALIVLQYIIAPDMTLLFMMYFPLLFVALQALAYIPNWKRAKALKEEHGWEAPSAVFAETKSSHSRGDISQMPWIWYILSFVLVVASVVVILVEYQHLPDMIPTHWDANMQPDAWSEKSYMTVLMMPLINLSMLVFMWVVGFVYVRAKLQIDAQNPQMSFAQHRIYRRRMGHCIGFMALCLVVMFMVISLMSVYEDMPLSLGVIIWVIILGTVPLVVVSVASGQGGCKIKPSAADLETAGDTGVVKAAGGAYGRLDDKRWALGLFYHNPDDPAIIVEDRFGNNLGLNYSRLPVKVFVVFGALVFVAAYIWITVVALEISRSML